jgi:uncharacterized alkaline shock family protein YloU
MSEKELHTHEFGHVNISDDVIGIITNIAAGEIEGVQLAGTLAGDIAEILGRKNMTKGVRVDITEDDEVQVDLNIVVDFGIVIPEKAWEVQESVKAAIENMTDLKVTSINVNVQGINLGKNHEKVDE